MVMGLLKARKRGAVFCGSRWLGRKHHGAQQIAARMESMVGLAAATGQVDNSIFDHPADSLVLGRERSRQIIENNRLALMEIMERLMEAEYRGYWQAGQQRLDGLRRAYLEADADLEDDSEKWIDSRR